MAVTTRSRCRTIVSKRHSWPKSRVHHLETIPESPRSPPKKTFSTEIESYPTQPVQAGDNGTMLNSLDAGPDDAIPEAIRTQMQWYSHHLAQSYRDRESLATRVSDLETVCKSQMKANTTLQKNFHTWQQNYEVIEAELIEASQEIEEARASIRQLKTANLNLRYTLCQLKDEQERAEQKKWSSRLHRSWRTSLRWAQAFLSNASCTSSKQQSGERPPARQDFTDKLRSVTPESQISGNSPHSTKPTTTTSNERFPDHHHPRPLSSHPPDQTSPCD